MTMTTSSSPTPLEYGRTASRRRKWFWAGVALVALVLSGYVAQRWGPSAWHTALLLRAQRTCLTYRAAPEQVVYEEDEPRAAALINADAQYVKYPLVRSPPQTVGAGVKYAASYTPRCWPQYEAVW